MQNVVIARENNALTLTVFSTAVTVIYLPIFVYGVWKLWRFREHLLFQKRFPIISCSIILLSFLNGLSLCLKNWIHYVVGAIVLSNLGTAISMFIYGLINIRLCLIYLRWKHHRVAYQIFDDVPNVDKYNVSKNIYYHWSCVTILIFTLASSVLFTVSLAPMILPICWVIQIIISIVVIVIVSSQKVKEGIGCLKETIILLVWSISVSCTFPLSNISVDAAFVFVIVTILSPYIIASIPLFFPLYCIHKMEGNLDTQRLLRPLSVIKLDDPLFVYIETKENYDLFSEYLSHCWALENLLFYQRASIIYQIILKYSSESNEFEACVDTVEDRNKFEYLPSIYEYYTSEMAVKGKSKVEFEDLRMKLYDIHKSLYDEFIKNGAINQINISYKTQQRGLVLFGKQGNVNVFHTYNDFLHSFDHAIIEVFRLLSSMYHYKYIDFLTSKQK